VPFLPLYFWKPTTADPWITIDALTNNLPVQRTYFMVK